MNGSQKAQGSSSLGVFAESCSQTRYTLPQAERFAYAKLLAHVTRIDDELSIDEMAVFEQRLGHSFPPISARNLPQSPPSLGSVSKVWGPCRDDWLYEMRP